MEKTANGKLAIQLARIGFEQVGLKQKAQGFEGVGTVEGCKFCGFYGCIGGVEVGSISLKLYNTSSIFGTSGD